MIQLIILRHGPNNFYQDNMQRMPDGEPYEAEILDADGNAVAVVYIGARDGVNKMVGGGVQVYEGDLSKIIAPRGTQVLDGSNNLWVSTGSAWKPVGSGSGSSSGNFDFGSYW